MDPSDKNWLKSYIIEISQKIQYKHDAVIVDFDKYTSIYDYIQFYLHSSGLFYGYVEKQFLSEFKTAFSWSYADNYKISFTEGFFLTYFFIHKDQFTDKSHVEKLVQEAAEKLYEFYLLLSITDSYFIKNKNLLSKNNYNYLTLEKIIDSRVNNPSMLKKGFWKGSQFNVFSYLDIMFFAHWLQNDYLYDKKNQIKYLILQTMIAASYSEGDIEKNEKRLVSYFLASGNFEHEVEEKLQKQIVKGLFLSSIEIDETLPYDIRLILFENAIVSVLSDSHLNSFEELFLGRLAERLTISEYDMQYSIVMIQNFLVQNNKHILYLHHKEGIEKITKSFTNRFQVFLQKNSTKIITEISESKELLELLWKAKNEKLTDEEREKVKEQIMDILRTIPSMTIFMIPGGSLLLPILFKILPEELLMPSSFRNKK